MRRLEELVYGSRFWAWLDSVFLARSDVQNFFMKFPRLARLLGYRTED